MRQRYVSRPPDAAPKTAPPRPTAPAPLIRSEPAREIELLPLPDLLAPRAHAPVDCTILSDVLELAFLGRETRESLDMAVEETVCRGVDPSTWMLGDDPGVAEFVDRLELRARGRDLPIHRRPMQRLLANPPRDLETIHHRQTILSELSRSSTLRGSAEDLYLQLAELVSFFKAARQDPRLNGIGFRLDILTAARRAVDRMVSDFSGAASGLRRLHEVGVEMQASVAFRNLVALLDHHEAMARLRLEVTMGADGRLRNVTLSEVVEDATNPLYRSPARRWWDLARLAWLRHSLDRREVLDRLVLAIYLDVAPAMQSLLQVMVHLEVYLAALTFADQSQARGLRVCLPEVGLEGPLRLEGLFNPLLARSEATPVACDLELGSAGSIVLVTGPNSGGKTRLLQAVAMTQVLGQSGLFVPCSRAHLAVSPGVFASIVQNGLGTDGEGRLGSELLRIRELFETAPAGSLVLLDELCSGTNPSEGAEIVRLVITLLAELQATAFVSTHFLDLARTLVRHPPVERLEPLQVAVDHRQRPTYRFLPGVAETSLAVGTADRLGVTFEALAGVIRSRVGRWA